MFPAKSGAWLPKKREAPPTRPASLFQNMHQQSLRRNAFTSLFKGSVHKLSIKKRDSSVSKCASIKKNKIIEKCFNFASIKSENIAGIVRCHFLLSDCEFSCQECSHSLLYEIDSLTNDRQISNLNHNILAI